MDSNAQDDREFSMEPLGTISFNSSSSSSSRGKMALEFLDKTSKTPTPTLTYANSNSDLLDGDDIPIVRPVGFDEIGDNSTMPQGKTAFI